MPEQLPRRWLIIGALILLATPCALVSLVGLLPEDTSEDDLIGLVLPVIVVGQVLFLVWYYRRSQQ